MNRIKKHLDLSILLPWLPPALTGGVAGLFSACVTFEIWPAQGAALATWPGAAGAAAAMMLVALGLRGLGLRIVQRTASSAQQPADGHSPLVLPFLLLLPYLLWPHVNLLMAGVLAAGATGLSLALGLSTGCCVVPNAARALAPSPSQIERQAALARTSHKALPIALAAIVLAVYLRTMGQTVGAADTFEFQVVAPTLGIAHPTGYPLLILIGKLFSLIPYGQVAWRVNLVSVTFALAATLLVYFILARLTTQRAIAALAALSLAFSRVFWSQAVEAEVYPLNAAFVAAILWLLLAQAERSDTPTSSPSPFRGQHCLFALAAVYGLSLTNHLTMAILAPVIALGIWLIRPRVSKLDAFLAVGCFLAPLLIELYTLLRWPALHNGEWMSAGAFISYITGQQFGGALQLGLSRDVSRWRIVSDLMLQAYGPVGAALAAGGLAWLAAARWSPIPARRWRLALLTFVAWIGYLVYGVIYNVPDISVFMIPAHILMAVWIGVAAARIVAWLRNRAGERWASWITGLAWTAFALLPLSLSWTNGPLVDQSQAGGELYRWGKYVLGLSMPTGSAILADSEKIAPLYYLKRIENVRPDVDTLVLGDEGLYRAELDRRVAAGQPVYLARYLPGLAGPYRLHSLGPLVRVTTKPMAAPPPMQKTLNNVNWGGVKVSLLGLDVERGQDDVAWRITLYWMARAKLDENYHVRLRWVGPSGQIWWQDHGAHPVGGYNPTAAWQPGEVVVDYHEIPADATIPPGLLRLDVGLFLPFRDEGLNRDGAESPWYTLVLLDQVPSSLAENPTRVSFAQYPAEKNALRASFGDELLITGVSDPGVLPPGEPVSIVFEWSRIKSGPDRTLQLQWMDARGAITGTVQVNPYAGEYPTSQWPVGRALSSRVTIPAPSAPGAYTLRVSWLDAAGRGLAARCGWLAPMSRATACAVGILRVAEPLQGMGGTARSTERSINFDNQALLLNAQIDRTEMRPNETLDVKLKWQGLRQWNANYTVFVHLIGPDGKLHGQVDRWPLDGTLPTTDWSPGRVVDDTYHVPLAGDAPPGAYQVEVGWYLLATLRRLPVVDAAGRPMDDRTIVGTVTVQP